MNFFLNFIGDLIRIDKPLFQIEKLEDLFQMDGLPRNNLEMIPFIVEKILKIERISTRNCSFKSLMSFVSDIMSSNKIMSFLEQISETKTLVRNDFATLLKVYPKIENVASIGKAAEVIKTIGQIENVLALQKSSHFNLIDQKSTEMDNLSQYLIENCFQGESTFTLIYKFFWKKKA